MIKIKLTNSNRFALIDDEDAWKVNDYTWILDSYWAPLYYAKATCHETLNMHHLILPQKEGFIIDHIDRDGLNNQKYNLRYATHAQNAMNRRIICTNTSGYKGVSKSGKKWKAILQHSGNYDYLGSFETKEEAALAYNEAALQYFGEFAYLNKIKEI